MTEAQKKWIDDASYTMMLRKWRFAKAGNTMFQGECGTYFQKVMKEKKAKLAPGEEARASKLIGWD